MPHYINIYYYSSMHAAGRRCQTTYLDAQIADDDFQPVIKNDDSKVTAPPHTGAPQRSPIAYVAPKMSCRRRHRLQAADAGGSDDGVTKSAEFARTTMFGTARLGTAGILARHFRGCVSREIPFTRLGQPRFMTRKMP